MATSDTPTQLTPLAEPKQRRAASKFLVDVPEVAFCSNESEASLDAQALAQLDADLRTLAVNNAFSRVQRAHAALQKKVTLLSFSDSLTGLKNRPALLISLQRAIDKSREQQIYSAVLLVDIDDFKSHNVQMGHLAGDMLLQQSAARMRQALGPDVVMARLFADKFVVVLEELGATLEEAGANAQRIATRVSNCFDNAFDINANAVPIRVSMGLCLIGMQDVVSTDLLIDRAELVAYNAKQAGGDCMFSFEFGAMEHGE